ncbi:ATP-dependent helicase/nuclease subunit A [compost metagenome]
MQILRHPDSSPDHIIPSDAAMEYQAQFDEVLLDEYQDTNTVQEDIVRLISCGGLVSDQSVGNRFMVGDVKQSIYRFRLAEPGLFLDKYRSYGDDFDGIGLRIDLARNFRSREEVVDAVNLLFRQIMNEGVAEISYDPRAELVYGEGFPENTTHQDYRPELLLIDRNGESSSSVEDSISTTVAEVNGEADLEEEVLELEAVRLEAKAIAARINELTGAGDRPPLMIFDKHEKRMRPVEYKDMVILLRSTLSWAPVFIEELRLEGVPAFGELSKGYFQASEVETMLSLLQIIDNPLQDIPLAAVLRSPLYGLNEEELAEIRLSSGGGSYYEAVLAAYAGEGDKQDDQINDVEGVANFAQNLKHKLEHFLTQMNGWRDMAREGELSSLIWSIYRDTGYLDWVGGLPGGSQRQGNLRALHDRARQYEMSTSSRGLFRFLRYIGRLRENGGDLGAAPATGEQGDAVKIMTIHKSKGLEFPVVFVAGLSKMFNRQDLNASFLMHKEMGFGPKFVDGNLRVSYPTLPNLAIRRRAQMELLAEEMRVLYVALTRPKDKLILISSVKDLAKSIEVWGGALEIKEEQLPDYILARGRCYLDWIGPSLIRHPAASELRRFGGLPDTSSPVLSDRASDWIISYVSARDVVQVGTGAAEAAVAEETSVLESAAKLNAMISGAPIVMDSGSDNNALEMEKQVNDKLGWFYPHTEATSVSAKTSVTEMKSLLTLMDEQVANLFEMQELGNEKEKAEEEIEFRLHLRRPRFMEQSKLTPTERGTAYHTLMQHLPLNESTDEEIVHSTLQRLRELQIMTEEQTAVIDAQRIADFLRGPIGDLLRRADWIKREMPFSYGLSASSAYPHLVQAEQLDQETVLIQGIVDCLFCVDGKQYLLDYKSDRVLPHKGGVSALTETYRFQLELYAAAVEDITGVPVEEKWLYFFDSGDAVRL